MPPNRWGPFAQLCALTASVARDTSGGPSGPTASQETSSSAPKRLPSPARVLYNATNNHDVDVESARRASPELLKSMAMVHNATDEARSSVEHRAHEGRSTLLRAYRPGAAEAVGSGTDREFPVNCARR